MTGAHEQMMLDKTVAQLERNVAQVVARLRQVADKIEREAKEQIESTRSGRHEWSNFGRVAQGVCKSVVWGAANCHLDNVVDAATEADLVRAQLTAETDRRSQFGSPGVNSRGTATGTHGAC